MNHFSKNLFKFIIVLIIFGYIMLLCGCAKTASESAADAALTQVGAVEQTIKKECPQAKIEKDMNALRATITSQLKTCEAEQARIRADKVKWQVIAGALLGALLLLGYIKILRK